MQHPSNDTRAAAARVSWNKVIGAKPPLQTKNVWSIRTKLQLDGRHRDLATFNLAIDSKLLRRHPPQGRGRCSARIHGRSSLPPPALNGSMPESANRRAKA